jgi:hypothetical protein
MTTIKAKPDEYQQQLQALFHITPEDLAANRALRLSAPQAQRLRREALWIALSGGGILTAALLSLGWFDGRGQLSAGFVMLFLLLLPIGYFAWLSWQRWHEGGAALLMVEGLLWKNVRVVQHKNYSTMYCTVQVGQHAFNLTPDQFNTLGENRRYKLYLTPQSHRLLSLEWVGLTPADQHDQTLLARRKQGFEQLQKHLRYDAAALHANQRGQLTTQQRAYLSRPYFWAWVFLVGLIVVGALIYWNAPSLPLGYWVLASGLGVFAWWNWRQQRQIQRDVRYGLPMIVAGTLRKWAGSTQGFEYWLIIDQQQFAVDLPTFNALVEFDEYEIAYLPHSRQLVSIYWRLAQTPAPDDIPF